MIHKNSSIYPRGLVLWLVLLAILEIILRSFVCRSVRMLPMPIPLRDIVFLTVVRCTL